MQRLYSKSGSGHDYTSISLYWICLCCFYRLKTAENSLNGHFILDHKALRQVYRITKAGHDLTRPPSRLTSYRRTLLGVRFNIFMPGYFRVYRQERPIENDLQDSGRYLPVTQKTKGRPKSLPFSLLLDSGQQVFRVLPTITVFTILARMI